MYMCIMYMNVKITSSVMFLGVLTSFGSFNIVLVLPSDPTETNILAGDPTAKSPPNIYYIYFIYAYIFIICKNICICIYYKYTYHIYVYIMYIGIQGSLNKFPDFFRMDTFIDSTHMKL